MSGTLLKLPGTPTKIVINSDSTFSTSKRDVDCADVPVDAADSACGTIDMVLCISPAELLAAWLRANDVRSFNAATLERVVVAAKTLPAGARVDVIDGAVLHVGKEALALALQER